MKQTKQTNKTNKTTVLPHSLLLGSDADIRFNLRFSKSTRKHDRKSKRDMKKVNRHTHTPNIALKIDQNCELNNVSIMKNGNYPKVTTKIVQKPKKLTEKEQDLKLTRNISQLKESNPSLFELLQSENLIGGKVKSFNDDYYEKKLGIKNGVLGKQFAEDGLDYLLNDLGQTEADDSKSETSDIDHEASSYMEEIDMAEISDDSASIIVNDDEIIIEENDQTDSSSKQNDSIVAASINIIEPVPLRYVPPHLKKPSADICIPNSSATADSQSRLQRQIQGQLNRLSDSTVNSVATHLEALYVNNPRHTITDMITRLLLGYIGSASNIHDTFICTYACFIACLHNSVNDFGAHFVQILISKLDYVSENAQMGESKCSLNYTSLISYLYNFNQMGHILIYDLIRKLLDNLNESNVESLLKILKISGGKLRSDDPSSLKEIIIMVSERNIKDLSYFQTNERLRSKFMVETIMDLKNNKKESVSNPIQLERLRKTVCSYLSSKGKSSAEPLGFSLSDLLSSNGKWWKTGNAWKGPADIPLAVLKNNTKLEKLAINLKMNTDSRKLVFYTLMSSTDYKHAVTLLLKLNLKGTPQRDLIRVPLYCLVHESSYNPFYTYVLSELLKSRTNQVSFQYAVWDHFKTMNSAQTLNLSQCITNLIIDGKVTLDILKSLDFIKLSSEEEKLVGAIVVKLVKDGKEGVFEMGNEDVKSGLSFFGRRLGKVGLTLAKILEKLRES